MSAIGTSRKYCPPRLTAAYGSKADSGKPSNGVFMSHSLRFHLDHPVGADQGPHRMMSGTSAIANYNEAIRRDDGSALLRLARIVGRIHVGDREWS